MSQFTTIRYLKTEGDWIESRNEQVTFTYIINYTKQADFLWNTALPEKYICAKVKCEIGLLLTIFGGLYFKIVQTGIVLKCKSEVRVGNCEQFDKKGDEKPRKRDSFSTSNALISRNFEKSQDGGSIGGGWARGLR